MASSDLLVLKRSVGEALRNLALAPVDALRSAATTIFSMDATCAGSHPINHLVGVEEIVEQLLIPMKIAMPDLERRDDILVAGHFAGEDWVSATGYYYGTMVEDWLGLPASNHWLQVRFGEFYRLVDGRVVDCYLLFDVLDVLRQLGLNPMPRARGIEGLVPGPATQDGLMFTRHDAQESRKSADLVDAMIIEGLLSYDRIDNASIGMERFWHPNMMWYGPAAIGSTRGLQGFLRHHQHPWQEAFPDYAQEPAGIDATAGVTGLQAYHEHAWQRNQAHYKGGKEIVRLADGNYVSWSGWPGIHATHTGADLFGMPASGRPFTVRVMDFWRRDGDLLSENWVLIDMPHLLQQLGVDVFEQSSRSRRLNRPSVVG